MTKQRKLPDGWQRVQLGDICEFIYGSSLPQRSRVPGDFPVYGSNGVVGSHHEGITNGATIIIGRQQFQI